MNFELVSGLSVNFDKCCLYGVNIDEGNLGTIERVLGCNRGVLPIPYLGLKIGGRLDGVAGWTDIVGKVERKLRGWEAKNLSIGGRVTLINSVIAAIPVYRMSFAQMPIQIAKKIRSLMSNFLWGGKEGYRKRAWIKWDLICKPKTEGGLGIRNLIDVNKALLFKWVWRFLGEEECLWSRVIKSRHGELMCGKEGIRLGRGGSSRGGWWEKMVGLADGVEGKWFREKLGMKLGDGKSVSFWEGSWSGDLTMKQRFPRLFHLSKERNGKVAEMGKWAEGRWRWEVPWRRDLLEREKGAVEELYGFLRDFSLVEGRRDCWEWGREGEGGAPSVKEAYREISAMNSNPAAVRGKVAELKIIWKSIAPLKAQIMSWRLLWNRLPTIDNLLKTMEVPPQDRTCRGCKSTLETASHFFLQCTEAGNVWDLLVSWVGVKWVPPRSLADHLQSFSGLLGGDEMRFRLGGLWICAVWVLWKWRNMVTFDDKSWSWKQIDVEIRCRFWSWCLVRGKASSELSFSYWANNSLNQIWSGL